jgi:putative ABC transport system permease protein
MRNMFYPRLAANNIKNNSKTYIPYILTCVFTVAMYYIMSSLALNEGLKGVMGSETVTYTLGLGRNVIAIFAVIFLFYTNSFLMKRRKKEFGLFNILGMEKLHIAKVVALETLYVALISLTAGLVLGMALDKAMYLLIMRVLGFTLTLGFYISKQSMLSSLALFGFIFVLILLSSLRQLQASKPIDLLQSKNAGESEPKTKWLMALLGVA